MIFTDYAFVFVIFLKDIQLRSYQLEGIKWLVARFKAHMGSILADEMGLGKTCQVNFCEFHLFSIYQF